MKRFKFKNKEIFIYLVFGVLTTLTNILTYYICDKTGLSTTFSTIIAWAISVLFAFITNKMYVFESRSKKILKEIILFFLSRISTGLLDLSIMVLFVDILTFNDFLIKAISNIVVIILNYIFSKLFVFKKKK